VNKPSRVLLSKLREIGSAEAAQWILASYPASGDNLGDAIYLIAHLSWKRREQYILAKHYLQRLPFASPGPYETFLSFMSVEAFLRVVDEYLPTKTSEFELLMYYLIPSLEKAVKSELDRKLVEARISDWTRSKR